MARVDETDGVRIVSAQLELEAAQWDNVWGYSRHGDGREQGGEPSEGDTSSIESIVEETLKGRVNRVYVDNAADAPEGANVREGDEGGLYYVPNDSADLDSSVTEALPSGVHEAADIPTGTEVVFDASDYGDATKAGTVVGFNADSGYLVVSTDSGEQEIAAEELLSVQEIGNGPAAWDADGGPTDVDPATLGEGDVITSYYGELDGEPLEVTGRYNDDTLMVEGPDGTTYDVPEQNVYEVLSQEAVGEGLPAPDDITDVDVGDTVLYDPGWFDEPVEAEVTGVAEEFGEVQIAFGGKERFVFADDFGETVFWQDDEDSADPIERLAAITDEEPDEVLSLGEAGGAAGVSAAEMSVEIYGDDRVFVTDTKDNDSGFLGEGEGERREDADRAMATFLLSNLLGGNVPPHNLDTESEQTRLEVLGVGEEDVRNADAELREKVDREEFLEQAAIQMLAGNSDGHQDNVRLGSDGTVHMIDLDHAAGDFTEADHYRRRGYRNLYYSGSDIGVVGPGTPIPDRQAFKDEIRDRAEQIAREVRGTDELEETLDRIEEVRQDESYLSDPQVDGTYEKNLRANIEAMADHGRFDVN